MTAHLDDQATTTHGGSLSLRLAARSAAAFVLLAVLVAAKADPVVSFDSWLSRAAHSAAIAAPLWRAAMAAVTVTGSTTVIGPLAALACLILLVRGRWRHAVFVVAALTITLGARLAVLNVVARPRPVDQLAPASSYAFPSGHTAASATAALVAVMVCWPMLRRRGSRIALAVVAGLWAVAVGVSRVALVVHWPTDVLGAWLFVLAVVPVVWWVCFRGQKTYTL
ncbi:phosphatase PAP2 family protein [Paractinoplanes lichenicola]|uniref:Phosphatase PAP2 family protein n=1 Tax=Paractinoplanes lichenicola TaxID=2802976 RepID=A0ABS1W0H4_9ACTN|nr:phosphatase PAP2 family protein [Actinoplanes lichenicola]MBL7260215.1 phosphatase PAP2 family protein [Actinoplanes lichenicola]